MTTVDRQRWLQERIDFLEALGAEPDLADEQRTAIEAELVALRAEQARIGGGIGGRWLRWLTGIRLPGQG